VPIHNFHAVLVLLLLALCDFNAYMYLFRLERTVFKCHFSISWLKSYVFNVSECDVAFVKYSLKKIYFHQVRIRGKRKKNQSYHLHRF
jgi:hypothetical protein